MLVMVNPRTTVQVCEDCANGYHEASRAHGCLAPCDCACNEGQRPIPDLQETIDNECRASQGYPCICDATKD